MTFGNRSFLLAAFVALLSPVTISAEVGADILGFLGNPAPPMISTPAFAGGFESAKAQPCSGVLRHFEVANPEVVPGEPVVFKLILKGDGLAQLFKEPEFLANLDFGEDLAATIMTERSRRHQPVEPARMYRAAPNSIIKLAEGQTITLPVILGCDRDSLSGGLIDDPGVYQVGIRLTCRGSVITSRTGDEQWFGPFTVTAVEGNEDDKKAAELLDKIEHYEAIHHLFMTDASFAPTFERLVAEAPRSRLRPYAMMCLSAGHYDQWTKTTEDASTSAHMKEARRLLVDFCREYPNHPARSIALNRLVRILVDQGDDDSSRALFQWMWTDPEMSMRLSSENPLRQWFLGSLPTEVTGDWMVFTNPADAMKPTGQPTDPAMATAAEIPVEAP